MVQKTTVTLIDDLDENITEDVQTVTFAHEGKTYEIDLGAENRQALDDALASYKAVARKAGRSTTSPSPRRTRVASDAGAIREWAAANGIEVNDRGRIPANIREQFDAAQK
ncbi:histone-like nucleoid-structuring protein Lsr2 [Litorihabitans aurantiacus]|uniref:Lsr2 family protein n=1 Tax=Litorihabitans aurantiacus TaxID=1930061 RepID=A0AA37XI25_9MICO|nr:Lsr2 family protein [Litorihabitans aurantiacus]GMA33765.1 Lsr2 family protein [Litorihabitans aurantiacus]